MLHASDKTALKNECIKAHRKAGKGKIKFEKLYGLDLKQNKELKLAKNWTYNPIKIDVVSYWYKTHEYYMTRGLRPGCIFS